MTLRIGALVVNKCSYVESIEAGGSPSKFLSLGSISFLDPVAHKFNVRTERNESAGSFALVW